MLFIWCRGITPPWWRCINYINITGVIISTITDWEKKEGVISSIHVRLVHTPAVRKMLRFWWSKFWLAWLPRQKHCRNSCARRITSCIRTSLSCHTAPYTLQLQRELKSAHRNRTGTGTKHCTVNGVITWLTNFLIWSKVKVCFTQHKSPHSQCVLLNLIMHVSLWSGIRGLHFTGYSGYILQVRCTCLSPSDVQ